MAIQLMPCGCASGAACVMKSLSLLVLPCSSPISGSYCPTLYTVTGGVPAANLSGFATYVNWMLTQAAWFENDSNVPWGSVAEIDMTDGASLPSAFTAGDVTVNPAVQSSGLLAGGGPAAAVNGGGLVCCNFVLTAVSTAYNIYVTNEGLISHPPMCQMPAGSPCYIPFPARDQWSAAALSTSYPSAYVLWSGSTDTSCPPNYTEVFSGTPGPCTAPDPFFGSDPP